MYYFGYCTWLSDAELRKYIPEARFVTKATAKNHRVEFRAAGDRRDRGWCHLANKDRALGQETQGIVFDVDDAHLQDTFEDFDIVYLTVHGADGRAYDCFTYVLSHPGTPMRPPNFYWRHVPHGLEEQDFPAVYRARVLATYNEAAECPDADRPAPSAKPSREASTR
ncbi:MAG: gamma-glutamylcyclotransferase [Chloroflexi bacterium]|nr:gamma-glutamylcyclotransferase [Chloroflexota bacterium]